MYILTFYERPVVACKDFERLNEYMARYSALEQDHMEVKELDVIK